MSLIITLFYQPFLNALVLIYWVLGQVIANPDMGMAVIVFTLLVRLLLFPLAFTSSQSADERREIGHKYQTITEKYKNSEPLKYTKLKKDLVREHKYTVRFEMINLIIQLGIAIILWRVFSRGLSGDDLHLIYSWIPEVNLPFNLISFGGIDLTKPSLAMNLLSAAMLFLVETLRLSFSPIPANLQDRAMQFLLPSIVFVYLYNMPAGKKFFIATTLGISVIVILSREMWGVVKLMKERYRK